MQSQQKKVKWSRGETSSALEERTDTGITNVSVARMENCIADIFGNVSRRPALKLLPIAGTSHIFMNQSAIKAYTFAISKDDYLILLFNTNPNVLPGYVIAYRIKNRVFVKSKKFEDGTLDQLASPQISFVQQNNYAVVASPFAIKEIRFTDVDGTDFNLTFQEWKYSAGWYAPNGTTIKSTRVGGTDGAQTYTWNNDKEGAVGYLYQNAAGEVIQASTLDTGVYATQVNYNAGVAAISPGDILAFPTMGASMKFYGWIVNLSDKTGANVVDSVAGVLETYQAVPSSGRYAKLEVDTQAHPIWINIFNNGTKEKSYSLRGVGQTGVFTPNGFSYIKPGEILWTSVGTDRPFLAVGVMLTPIVNNTYKDTAISITTGYESLTPEYNVSPRPPNIHPQVLTFSSQRLWTANFGDSNSLVIGSQIGKYNDLSNDYNGANEAITLDILTPYQEQVRYMMDYNGLKIFTDVSEWAYESGGAVKQSNNGIFLNCTPIVFHSVGVYVDATGRQVRAMSYELGANIFNSSVINKLCANDLVFEPIKLTYLDEKQYSVGRFLFVLNNPSNNTTNPQLAVCNFVPDTQNMIWNRWSFPGVNGLPLVQEIVQTPTEPIFMVRVPCVSDTALTATALLPAVLDFDANTDMEVALNPNSQSTASGSGLWRQSLAGQRVSVFDNGVWQWDDTVNTQGNLTKSIAGLSNPSAGYMINAVLDSHPIDIGGKTKSVVKRISKAIMSVRDTEPGAITINGKTGYMNPAKDMINFYGITGMKREITYKITNIKGAKYRTLDSTKVIPDGTLIS